MINPLLLGDKGALWVGEGLYSGYPSLPHRQRALRDKVELVLAANEELAEHQQAVRPQLAERMGTLVHSYDGELRELAQGRSLLPHRRRALRGRVDLVQRKRALAEDALRL